MFKCAAPTPPVSAMAFLSGQNKVKCPLHALLLCVGFRSSGYLFFRQKIVPINLDGDALMSASFLSQKHFIESEKTEIEFSYGVHRIKQSTDVPKFCTQSGTGSDESSSDEYFVPPFPTSDEHYASMDTDAAVPSAPIEVPDNSSDMSIIAAQAILNSHMAVRIKFASPMRVPQDFVVHCSVLQQQSQSVLFH